MSTPPFVRLYANDWFTGVAGLKADERGVYISMCVFIWTTGRRVPLDDAESARLMAINFKSYQRIRDRLVVLGKVTKHENGYGNERAESELSAAIEAHAKQVRRTEQVAGRGNGSGEEKPASARAPIAEDAKADKPILINGAIDHAIDVVIDHMIDVPIDTQKLQQNQPPSIEPEPEPELVSKNDDLRDEAPVSFFEGQIVLSAKKTAFWIPNFGNDAQSLALALIQAAGYTQPNDTSYSLEVKIDRQLAKLARDKRDQDQRYAKAAEANAAKRKTEPAAQKYQPSLESKFPVFAALERRIANGAA
jgi:uncharacterized protein YdaU (DUF1376 family)